MKTKIILATLLMLALPMTATNKKNGNKFAEQKARLTGIWQQCLPMTTNDGGRQIRFLPHFKILSSDGTFCNMSQASSVAPAALFATGEWRITSDSTFVEHLATNANSVYEGKDNELTFRLPMGNQVLEVFYTMPGDTRRIREAWIRVQEGDAVAIAQKYFERLNGIQSDGNNTLRNQQNLIIEEGQESDENLSLTENPRGIYKLMALKGKEMIKPYIGDIYKIVTDSVTMRLQVNNANRKLFMIDIPDFRPFNYTGARTDLDLIDKSTRVYDSNSKRFTQKWWSTIPNHTIFPYNQWCYEYYESGKYSEAAKPIFDELRTSQQSDPKNQLIGTWKSTMEIQMIAGDGVENWVEDLKKVDNWKEMLAYLNQTNPKREYNQNDFAEYYIFTPSKHFFFAMFYKRQLVAGEYDNITYNGKETFISGDNHNRRIYWLTKDAFVMNSNPVGKERWCIYERVTDKNTMLSRICSHFIQHKE